jgi:hypothetical protein
VKGLRSLFGCGAVLLSLAGTQARAGAWPLPPGQGQAILKFDEQTALGVYGSGGALEPAPVEGRDRAVSLFVEYGLIERLTLQGKWEARRRSDDFVDYEGSGPSELGLRGVFFKSPNGVASGYVGLVSDGADVDAEARLFLGRSNIPRAWRVRVPGGYVELQAARIFRSSRPDESRLDLTAGIDLNASWSVGAQTFAGTVDGGGAWAVGEASITRSFDEFKIQAGWRRTLAGRETRASQGPVVAIWRRF